MMASHNSPDGQDLADHVDRYNAIRPHEALALRRPLDAYLAHSQRAGMSRFLPPRRLRTRGRRWSP